MDRHFHLYNSSNELFILKKMKPVPLIVTKDFHRSRLGPTLARRTANIIPPN
jgi:hypothetical protein